MFEIDTFARWKMWFVFPIRPRGTPRGTIVNAAIENELLTLNANLNAATYRFLVLIRAFDRRAAGADWGVRSMAHWLGWRCRIGLVAAREHVRLAHALADLPETSACFTEGRISYSKVSALTRVTTAETEAFFFNVARYGTADHLERIVRCARQDPALDDPNRVRAQLAKSFCDWYFDDDGVRVLRARLMPDDGARLVGALEAMSKREIGGPRVPAAYGGERHEPAADFREPGASAGTHHERHEPAALPISARIAIALAAIAEAAVSTEPEKLKGSVPQIVLHVRSGQGTARAATATEAVGAGNVCGFAGRAVPERNVCVAQALTPEARPDAEESLRMRMELKGLPRNRRQISRARLQSR